MALNKRERKMIYLTVSVVISVGLSMLMRKGDPAEAAAPETATASAPAEVEPSAAGDTAKAESPPELAHPRRPILIAQLELQLQLDRMSRRPDAFEIDDPFRYVDPDAEQEKPKVDILTLALPSVSGVFYSSISDRSAVLDGQLVFLGESFGEFRLSEVDDAGVTLEAGGKNFRIEYDPLSGGGAAGGTPQ